MDENTKKGLEIIQLKNQVSELQAVKMLLEKKLKLEEAEKKKFQELKEKAEGDLITFNEDSKSILADYEKVKTNVLQFKEYQDDLICKAQDLWSEVEKKKAIADDLVKETEKIRKKLLDMIYTDEFELRRISLIRDACKDL